MLCNKKTAGVCVGRLDGARGRIGGKTCARRGRVGSGGLEIVQHVTHICSRQCFAGDGLVFQHLGRLLKLGRSCRSSSKKWRGSSQSKDIMGSAW